jgi:hypothetical protein
LNKEISVDNRSFISQNYSENCKETKPVKSFAISKISFVKPKTPIKITKKANEN